MLKSGVEYRNTDVLIVGAGGAGARAAVAAAQEGAGVTLVCRSLLGRGGATPTGNGGYHVAIRPGDSPAIHAQDLIAMGCNLNDRNLVGILTQESLEQARFLESLGANITWEVPSRPSEPEMRFPRNLFIPGKEIMAALGRQIRKQSNVTLLEDVLVVGLLTGNEGVAGALLLDLRDESLIVCQSKATLLATGGLGELYPLTAQEPMGIPTGCPGSGYVMAGLAGADLVDMEMVQFTAVPVVPKLISAMRCLPAKGTIYNRLGEDFIDPRVGSYSYEAARAILQEVEEGRGPVYMYMPENTLPKGRAHKLAALRNKQMWDFEVTPYQRRVEIGIGELFMMGGAHINERCETSAPRLYAAGEVAASVHGARRVSGNAFPEMIVFGARAGKNAALAAAKEKAVPGYSGAVVEEVTEFLRNLKSPKNGEVGPRDMKNAIRTVMGQNIHLIRSRSGLESARKRLSELENALPEMRIKNDGTVGYDSRIIESFDCRWMLQAARIICEAALLREESRGFHYRQDFPQEKEDWVKHTVVRSGAKGWTASDKPVSL